MLTKVEIKNFQSINKMQTLKFNKDITAIIGKNEAGKSGILRAIEKLNGIEIDEDEKNVNSKDETSQIKAYFKIDKEEIKKLNLDYFGLEENVLGIYKLPEEYDELYYSLCVLGSKTRYYSLYYMKDGKLVSIDTDLYFDRVKKELEHIKSEFDDEMISEENEVFDKFKNAKDETEIIELYNQNVTTFTEEIKQKLDELIGEIKKNKWIDTLPKYKFVRFSSFSDVLNDEISLDDVDDNIQTKNLLRIAKIDIDKFKTATADNKQSRITTMEKQCDVKISSKFKEIYKQADNDFVLRLKIDTKENKLFFFTNDNTSEFETIPLSKRSDGFRWYFSMYLTLYDYIEEKDDFNYILLIDEPNMYLHASAQKDLLERVFKNEFKDMQILYSTHSPYIIDADNLYSLKIVEKDEQTKIYNSPQDYVNDNDSANIDTITPLLTALDLHISNSLTFDFNDKVLLVEGIQDLYILKSFIKILGFEEKFKNIKIVACMGSSKICYMYSYLVGMGYQTYLLVDDDKAGRDTIKSLSLDVEDADKYFLKYAQNDKNGNCLLEDLFTEEDKNTHIPKKNNILYKRILDNSDVLKFETKTKNNFKKQLELIFNTIDGNDKDIKKEKRKEELINSEFSKSK